MLTIINYGMGNLRSIENMLKYIGVEASISSDPARIAAAEKLILPGVGAFDAGMSRLTDLGLVPLLNELVLEKGVPILGICLGMQLFTRFSEEGKLPGLGWFDASTVRFRFDGMQFANGITPRIPHMGWNVIHARVQPGTLAPHPVLADLAAPSSPGDEDPRFYFVHGYHVQCSDPADVIAATEYGYPFHAVIGRDNLVGTQFHPEKSHRYGMRLLENFVRWQP